MKKVVGASILGVEDKAKLINELIDKGVNWIHYDVMDGIFVKNKSLPMEELNYILANTKEHTIDMHLMVADPLKYFMEYSRKVNYISFHYEAESFERIEHILKEYSRKVNIGLAINPKTNIEQIYEYIPDLAFVLVMSVIPGQGGQSFIPETLEKITKLRAYLDKFNPDCFIQVDGGINNETGPKAIKAGASALVSGSYLIKNMDDVKILKKILGA